MESEGAGDIHLPQVVFQGFCANTGMSQCVIGNGACLVILNERFVMVEYESTWVQAVCVGRWFGSKCIGLLVSVVLIGLVAASDVCLACKSF